MSEQDLSADLHTILERYRSAFDAKTYSDVSAEHDVLMDVFGLTPETKAKNRQYWGRELGMCWQRIVSRVFSEANQDFGGALRIGSDEPCDFTFDKYAVDTKYRIGSGDSGTLKKFRSYGPLLRQHGYTPVMLILRADNLRAAIRACEAGSWQVLTSSDSFRFVESHSGFDLHRFLTQRAGAYAIRR